MKVSEVIPRKHIYNMMLYRISGSIYQKENNDGQYGDKFKVDRR